MTFSLPIPNPQPSSPKGHDTSLYPLYPPSFYSSAPMPQTSLSQLPINLSTPLTPGNNNRIHHRRRPPLNTLHSLQQHPLQITSLRYFLRHHTITRRSSSYSRVIWDLGCEGNVEIFVCGFGSDSCGGGWLDEVWERGGEGKGNIPSG